MQHRTTQPYQNVAPVHHIQPSQPQAQSRTLSSSQPQQQPYPSPNVYTPQSGLQSPFLNQPPQFQQQQQGPNDPPTFYTSNPSPRSQHSGGGPYYPTGEWKSQPLSDPRLTWSRRKTRIHGSFNYAEALPSHLQHSPVKFPGFSNFTPNSRSWEAYVWTATFTAQPTAVWISTISIHESGAPTIICGSSCTDSAAPDEFPAYVALSIHNSSAFARSGYSPPFNNLEQPKTQV